MAETTIIVSRTTEGSALANGQPVADFPAFVFEQEPRHPRWVWDDTVRWYPALLEAGIRIERCTDLRLAHHILRRSPFVDQAFMVGPDTQYWDELQPAVVQSAGLFDLGALGGNVDVRAEYDRQRAALDASTERGRLRLLLAAESSGALAAAEMTHVGLPWRADIHDGLLTEALGPQPPSNHRPAKLEALANEIRAALAAPTLNPDSPAELLQTLRANGLDVKDTRSHSLQRHQHPVIAPLLSYKKLSRLLTANGWFWLDTWVHNGRFRPTYLPGGVVSGRWAALGGGALQVPAQLRPAVVADPGWRFVVADVKQLEPRVLAGMSSDGSMAEAARATDLYQAMVDTGVVQTRNDAKLGMLGAMYGATRGEGGRMIARLTQRYPRAVAVVEEAARAGERGDVVHTLLGRGSPVPNEPWAAGEASPSDGNSRRSWGRFTRNFVVQGTGAEWTLCWIATLRNALWALNDEPKAHLVFFLHDEVIVHTPAAQAGDVVRCVQEAATEAGRLLFGSFPVDFPLDVHVVDSWAEAG